VEQTKGALRSNINLTGILVILVTALNDPLFSSLFGQWVTQDIIGRIGYVLGLVIMYLRSNGAPNIPVEWSKPFSPPSPPAQQGTVVK
jgi:hypothetical protein